MKKCLSVIFSLIFVFTAISIITANAASSVTVYSPSADATAGETIKLPVYISNNTGLLGFKLIVDYDSDIFTPVSVDYGELLTSGLQDNIEGDSTPGEFCVYWAGTDSFSSDGIMFYLTFKVSENATGSSQIVYSYSQEDTFDVDFNDVVLNCEQTEISITNNKYSSWGIFSLSAEDFEGNVIESDGIKAGDSFLVAVESNLSCDEDDFSAEFQMEYDSDNFTFEGFYDSSKQEIEVSNQSDDAGKVSYSSEAQIKYLCFKAADNASRGTYSFTIGVTNYNVDYVKGGSVDIIVQKSDTSETAVIYSRSDLTAEKDEVFTVPVYISNNHGIMGYRLDFGFDSEKLEIQNVSSAEAFEGNFNDSIGNEDGSFYVVWNATEENKTDGSLLNITFKALTDVSENTSISVSFSQADTFNEAYEDVLFSCSDINIALNSRSGAVVKGSVLSVGTDKAAMAEIQLIPDGSDSPAYTAYVAGISEGEYKISDVANGTYTLKIVKDGYITHEETVEITSVNDDKAIGLVTLYLYGDVNTDGIVDNTDVDLILQAAGGIVELSEQQFVIADIDGDTAVDAFDSFELDKIVNA